MSPQEPGTITSDMLRENAKDLVNVKVGDIVRRIWPAPMPDNKMRVCKVDETFIYCNSQSINDSEWHTLPEGSEPWKFDREYGVETDEEMGWGVQPYGSRNVILTRIEVIDERDREQNQTT